MGLPRVSARKAYCEGEQRDVGVAVVDIVDDRYSGFSRPFFTLAWSVDCDCSNPYALPFLELIRSAISRSRARLGSKFMGSTAFSGESILATLCIDLRP